ncbi:MAG: riboflavin kinase [Patescibacteria group bacterium]|nr:riboflavin kinase [Patescibacteria group bacterium]
MKVIKGKGLGRKLGFPTINFKMNGEKGVFLVKVNLDEKEYFGAMHRDKIAEIFIFNYKGNAYGKEVKVEVLEKIRDSWKFDTLEGLKRQIGLDVEMARERVDLM